MNRVLTNSMIFIGCEILSKSVPFLLLPYLTRVLHAEDFGALGLFTSLQALFIIGVSLSFDGALARYFYRYGSNNFDALLYHSLFLISILCFVFLCILQLTPWNNFLIKYALITAALQAFFNVILTSKQCQKKAFQYAFYQISFAIISASSTVILFKIWSYDVDTRIKSIFISLLIVIFIFLSVNKRRNKRIFNLKAFNLNVLYYLSFGLPLIIHQLSLYIKGQFDRVLIAHSFSLSELAIYTAAFQLASCVNVIIMALNKALVPYYFEACKSGFFNANKVRKWFMISIPATILPACVMMTFPDELFSFILGPGYVGIKNITIMFVLGFSMQVPYLLAVNFMFYNSNNKLVAFITFSSSFTHLILLYILKDLGVSYIPFALIFSNTICLIMLFFIGIPSSVKKI